MALEDILSAMPEAGTAAKKDFMWKLTRLFEIYRGVLYIFMDETWKKCEEGTNKTDYGKMEDWIPEFLRDFG